MLPDSPAPQADPLAEFKQAFEKYQKCQAYCVEGQEQFDRGGIAFVQGKSLERRRIERRIAAEGLWVSGMAGLFSLLTTNYQAQERLVAEQVKGSSRDRQVDHSYGHRRRCDHRIHRSRWAPHIFQTVAARRGEPGGASDYSPVPQPSDRDP